MATIIMPVLRGKQILETSVTLVAGTYSHATKLPKVVAVFFTQNSATPVNETFGWTFVPATGILTINSSNSSSTATIQFKAIQAY